MYGMMRGSVTESVDILIVLALKLELDALLKVEAGRRVDWVEVRAEYPYWTATFEGNRGPIRVAAARLTEMGGVATALVAERLSEQLQPKCLAMCGVCAGHPEHTDRGDVIIADRVFQHDVGKQNVSGFQGDLWVHAASRRWRYVAQELEGPAKDFHGYGEPDEEAARWWFLDKLLPEKGVVHDPLRSAGMRRYFPDERRAALLEHLAEQGEITLVGETYQLTGSGKEAIQRMRVGRHGTLIEACPYHIHVGPIGSGSKVEADGEIWERLANGGMRKILGVEMEAATIGAVAQDRGMPFAVAKAVMDHADPKKSDRYKPFAARASAEVLMCFLRRVVGEAKPSARLKIAGAGIGVSLIIAMGLSAVFLADDSSCDELSTEALDLLASPHTSKGAPGGPVTTDPDRLQRARRLATEALQSDSECAPAYNVLGLYYSAVGQPWRSIAELKKAVALEPENCAYRLHLASGLTDVGETENAAPEMALALKCDPENPTFHYQAAGLALATMNVELAAEYIEKALQLDPTREDYHSRAAKIAWLRDDALAALHHAGEAVDLATLHGVEPFSYTEQKARILADLGRHNEAIATLRGSCSDDVWHKDTCCLLALNLFAQGKPSEAKGILTTIFDETGTCCISETGAQLCPDKLITTEKRKLDQAALDAMVQKTTAGAGFTHDIVAPRSTEEAELVGGLMFVLVSEPHNQVTAELDGVELVEIGSKVWQEGTEQLRGTLFSLPYTCALEERRILLSTTTVHAMEITAWIEGSPCSDTIPDQVAPAALGALVARELPALAGWLHDADARAAALTWTPPPFDLEHAFKAVTASLNMLADSPVADADTREFAQRALEDGVCRLLEPATKALEAANEKMHEATGEQIDVISCDRSNELQISLFNHVCGDDEDCALVANVGESFHEMHLAVDVRNWKRAGPYLAAEGFAGGCTDVEDGLVHFWWRGVGGNREHCQFWCSDCGSALPAE
jgi:nucleoside phosphorylase/tetratricopeptide (TPR) repeat protein